MYQAHFDLHTHTISSGHGSTDTLTDLAKAASAKELHALGISDHGPATPGSAKESYFRNLPISSRAKFGVSLFYGVELNILNGQGDVDLPASILSNLDYAIVSMHLPTFKALSKEENTLSYISAMRHPKVRFLGHIDDGRYPIDFLTVLTAAKEHNIYPEINNRSLMPEAYRTDGHQNCKTILEICKKLDLSVLLSSDSHGKDHVGDFSYIYPLLASVDFPERLVLNSDIHFLNQIL